MNIAISPQISDLLRYLVLGQAMFVIVLSSAILIRYILKFIRPKQERLLLPWHIVLIAYSYISLTIWALMDLRIYWGEPATWRVWMGLNCFVTGDAALIFMLMHMHVRKALVSAVLQAAKEEVAQEIREQQKHVVETVHEIADTAHATKEAVEEIKTKLDNGK